MKDCVRAAALEERALPKTKRIMCFVITGLYPKESPVEVAKREELADITAGDRLASKAGTLGDDEARQGELEELLDPRGLL